MKLNIGTVIRDRRRALNITQEQLAERLGVTCQSVSRWETCMTYPDIEFLPVLADLFGITLDELMGHTKSAREMRLARLWEEQKSIEDPEEKFAHLARMREEYPNEWEIAHVMLELITGHGIHREDLISLAMEILKNCPDELIRWDVVKIYLHDADEEDITPDFLERFTQRFSRNSLLQVRYKKKEDWAQYDELRQRNLLDQMFEILDEQLCGYGPPSADRSLWAYQTAMSMLHLMTGYHAETVSDIVDPQPDLWFAFKYVLGIRLSCALTAKGQNEDALTVLEGVVTLLENVLQLPEGTVLSYRSPALDCMEAAIVSCAMIYPLECGIRIQPLGGYSSHAAADTAFLRFSTNEEYVHYYYREADDIPGQRVWTIHLNIHTWEGFAPIRNHPRFLSCAERMQALDESLKNKG